MIQKHSRIFSVAAAACVLVALIFVVRFGNKNNDRPFEGQTLHIYNWGEYTGENIISAFEEETGAKVVMDHFDSNEQMYIKVANISAFEEETGAKVVMDHFDSNEQMYIKVANQESYDLLVPSDYMIQRLIDSAAYPGRFAAKTRSF